MRVGICDFPSDYAFPPHGYGGIERWLWAVAVGARRVGAQVHLLGPAWRDDLPGDYLRLPVRLEDLTDGDAALHGLREFRLDLMIAATSTPHIPGGVQPGKGWDAMSSHSNTTRSSDTGPTRSTGSAPGFTATRRR